MCVSIEIHNSVVLLFSFFKSSQNTYWDPFYSWPRSSKIKQQKSTLTFRSRSLCPIEALNHLLLLNLNLNRNVLLEAVVHMVMMQVPPLGSVQNQG